jgi:hypothetical protein
LSKRIPVDFRELRLLDIRNPEFVTVTVSEDGKKLWVNVDDMCVLRVQNVTQPILVEAPKS